LPQAGERVRIFADVRGRFAQLREVNWRAAEGTVGALTGFVLINF
jgi:hypothetical protein